MKAVKAFFSCVWESIKMFFAVKPIVIDETPKPQPVAQVGAVSGQTTASPIAPVPTPASPMPSTPPPVSDVKN